MKQEEGDFIFHLLRRLPKLADENQFYWHFKLNLGHFQCHSKARKYSNQIIITGKTAICSSRRRGLKENPNEVKNIRKNSDIAVKIQLLIRPVNNKSVRGNLNQNTPSL